MDGGGVLHRGCGSGGQAPVAVEFKLQSAALVGVNRRRAEASMQTIEHWKVEPYVRLGLSWVGQRGSGEDVEAGLRAACRDHGEVATEALVGDQIAHVASRGLVDLAGSLSGIDVERVAGSGHGDVEQAALFLVMKRLVVRLS